MTSVPHHAPPSDAAHRGHDPEPDFSGTRVRWPSLLTALAIMLVGSIYPMLFTGANDQVDHGFASALFWAMCAGLVHGIGFRPRHPVARWLLSGWACIAGLLLAAILRWGI